MGYRKIIKIIIASTSCQRCMQVTNTVSFMEPFKKNNWKIAFWICLVLLSGVSIFSIYSAVDQAVTLNYMQVGYKATETDLDYLSRIINETDFSKTQIKKVLTESPPFDELDLNTDTISLTTVSLIF